MKITIEITPVDPDDFAGEWRIALDGGDPTTLPDVTYATERATDAVDDAMCKAYEDIEEYYR